MENDKSILGAMACNQIDFISKMYDMKMELLREILELQIDVKRLKKLHETKGVHNEVHNVPLINLDEANMLAATIKKLESRVHELEQEEHLRRLRDKILKPL